MHLQTVNEETMTNDDVLGDAIPDMQQLEMQKMCIYGLHINTVWTKVDCFLHDEYSCLSILNDCDHFGCLDLYIRVCLRRDQSRTVDLD